MVLGLDLFQSFHNIMMVLVVDPFQNFHTNPGTTGIGSFLKLLYMGLVLTLL
jgi:hypothetical protein